MKRYVRLSYNIGIDTPLYPNTNPIAIEKIKEISKGDSCNTFLITFSNHTGTHIDAPRHFWDSGRTISKYPIDELVFKRPFLIDCPKEMEEAIEINDLASLTSSNDCDLLLMRTGFHKYRSKDIYTYCHKNPYLSSGAARWIRENCLHIKAIAIDCISISSYANQEIGRETHKIVLKEDGFKGPAVLLIEDMYIPSNMEGLKEVMVVPLYVNKVDSSPCTVIAVFEQ